MSNVQPPKGLVGALTAAAEKEAPKPADKVYEGYGYLVSLQNGLRFKRLASQEPEKLWRAWAQARRNDELLVWSDDAATEARQIADIELDLGEGDADVAEPPATAPQEPRD
jgi:hypothetical protein